MFDFLDDITKGIGSVLGTVTGSILGLTLGTVAKTLGITKSMVQEALDAGCTTYEEVKDYFNLK